MRLRGTLRLTGLGLAWLGLWLLAAMPVHAAGVGLHTRSVELVIGEEGGLPLSWLACAGACADPAVPRQQLAGPGAGSLRWAAGDPALAEAMATRRYLARVQETPDSIIAELLAEGDEVLPALVQRYELSRSTHVLRMQLSLPPGVELAMESGAALIPEQLPGFGAAFSDVYTVRVGPAGQEGIGGGAAAEGLAADAEHWTGVRSRFWAWLAQPTTTTQVSVQSSAPNHHRLSWQAAEGVLDLAVYAGPLEWKSLRVVSFDLTRMLFASLWEPLRWLCLALLFLLAFIQSWVSSEGLAIILLSLAVKIILAPATYIADRWQAEVNRAQSRLQPRLAEIRRQFRGEEAHRLTLQAYREEGVHPLYTFKSLAGFAIQVPMFIAAFDMLAGNFALDGVPFLWIADLAAPDRLARLPFVLPFFGADLNLLPFLMTAVSILSALVQQEASLNAALQARQRRNLYLMALAFFLLFYTFPAGMVLYWTANNVWHLLKVMLLHREPRATAAD